MKAETDNKRHLGEFDKEELYRYMRAEERKRMPDLKPGWYQSDRGDLFQYDGVIWDKVPDQSLRSLEYLG
jgi:hypothetical protein